jgi:hypothetical protein
MRVSMSLFEQYKEKRIRSERKLHDTIPMRGEGHMHTICTVLAPYFIRKHMTYEVHASMNATWSCSSDTATSTWLIHTETVACAIQFAPFASCSCSRFKMWQLPCRHALRVLDVQGEVLRPEHFQDIWFHRVADNTALTFTTVQHHDPPDPVHTTPPAGTEELNRQRGNLWKELTQLFHRVENDLAGIKELRERLRLSRESLGQPPQRILSICQGHQPGRRKRPRYSLESDGDADECT